MCKRRPDTQGADGDARRGVELDGPLNICRHRKLVLQHNRTVTVGGKSDCAGADYCTGAIAENHPDVGRLAGGIVHGREE